jgi:hypothetical protein
MTSMGITYADDQTFALVIPLLLVLIQLNLVISPRYGYDRSSCPPLMYITSILIPACV